MSVTSLSTFEQKKALSGKKKKKVMKNVLGLPDNLKVEPRAIKTNEENELREIIERLLPSARLQNQPGKSSKQNKATKVICEENDKEAISRRKQLALGVNAVYRGVKKKIISAVLFANDIQPMFLVQHLNLLCTHNNVPFLYMPKLRESTKLSLGFPCIALGFKKEFDDFSKVVDKIKVIFESQSVDFEEENRENKTEKNECSNSESSDEELNIAKNEKSQNKKIEFTYLTRTSNKERVFNPETSTYEKTDPENTSINFYPIPKDEDNEDNNDSNFSSLGISQNNQKHKSKVRLLCIKDLDIDVNNEDDFKMPRKKKNKKEWMIDKVGVKREFKYSPTNLIKTQSNPNRIKRKNKELFS